MEIISDGRIVIDTEIDSSGAEKGLEKTVSSAKSQAAKLAAEYKKQGMSASEAFTKAWSEIERDSDQKSKDTANNWKNNLSGKLGEIAKTGLVAFTGAITAAGAAIGGLAGIATKYNSQMEDYFANFTVLLGSAEKATQHVEDLKRFAADTPFEMPGIADSSKQLLSFGIGIDDIMPSLQMLGDISLGNQEKFKGLSLVFAQVASAGKLTGQDLLQFVNWGFNPLQAIAEKTGKSMADLKEEMSDGKISYEMVAEAMKDATSEGGKFYQGMEVQSKTLSGMWSTLKDDTMSLIGNAFLPFSNILKNNVMPALQGMVGQMTQAFADPNIQASIVNIANSLGELAINIGNLISEYLPKIIQGFAWMLDNSNVIAAGIISIGTSLLALNVISMMTGLISAFKGVKTATEAWIVVQKLLNATMFANPIGLIVAAIAGLVAGIVYLWKTNDEFKNAIIGSWNAIKDTGVATWNWLVKFFTEDIPNAFNFIIDFFKNNWQGLILLMVNPFLGAFKLIYDNCEGFRNFINNFATTIADFIKNSWQSIVDGTINAWNGILNFINVIIPNIINSIANWFSELPYKIGYSLGYTLGIISKWGVDTWNNLTTTCINIYNTVTEWFSKLPERIYTFTMDIYNKVVKWGQDTWNKFTEICTNIYNSVTDWFSKLPGVVWSFLVNTYNNVVTWGRNTYTSMYSAASNAISSVIDWFSSLPGRIWSWLLNTVSKVYQFGQNLGSTASQAGSNMVSNITNAVSNLPSQMYSVGMNIVKGVWNGITGMGSWISSKVSGFFTGIVDGAKAALGIKSPSRVFRDEVGKYMAQGVGVGFEDETDNVEKSMNADFEKLFAKMQTTVDYETTMTTARVVAHNNVLSGGVEEENKINKENKSSNPTVVLNIDGREFMRATAPYQDEYSEYYDGR